MQVTEIKNEGLELHFEVTIPSNNVAKTIDAKLSELAKNAKLPGFRPGKVPLKIVEQKYKASIVNEAIQQAVQEQVNELVKSKKLKLATQGSVEDLKYEDGKDVSFKVILEVMPEITLTDFSKFKITKPVIKLKEAEIDSRVKELFASKASYKKAAKTAKAAENDKVIIDFEGFVNNEAFAGGKSENFGLVLGSKSFIPGFEDQLIGSKAGDDVVVKVEFPKDYRATDLAGKEAEFKVKVHEVQKPEKFEIDDEKAKEFGATDLADLRQLVENITLNSVAEPVYTYQKMKLFDQLEKNLTFDVPASLIKKELSTLQHQIEQFKDEDKDLKEKTPSEIGKYSEKVALRRVRIGLMLADYAERNHIIPTTEDFRAAVTAQARNFPGNEQQVFEFYQKNPQAVQSLAGPILEDKAVKHILETKIKAAEKEYTIEAFNKLMEEEN